ncbi:hypothetical protein [Trueperella pyogenes]
MVDVNARLVVYAPDGEKQGVLRFPASWDASMPWNDTPALRFMYGTATPDSDLLNGACEVALEVATPGGGWVEPVNARYCVMESSVDSALGKAGQVQYTAPGYASLLGGVCVVPSKYGVASAYTEDGKRKFNSALPGEIISTVLAEARHTVNGLLPGLELGFTKQQDSSGAPWARKISLDYEPGISLLTILENLAAQGQCDWWLQGRTLHVVNPDSTATRTRVVVDRPVSERPIRSSLAGLLHTAFLVGEKGKTWRVDNADTIRPWGASMRVITQGGVNEEATARRLVDAQLQAGKRERTEYTAKVPLDVAGIVPLTDFRVGDWIQAPGRGGKLEPMRVHQCTINFADSTLAATLTLNDRFVDAQVRAAKRTKGIVNGASGDAGTGSLPGRREPARPLPVEGLVAESEGYWSDTGDARSVVRASWKPATKDERGSAVQVAHYRVQVGTRTVHVVEPSATVDELVPGKRYDVTVWVVDTDGLVSDPVVVSLVAQKPLERLNPPTRFTINSEYGMVTVIWDGMLQGTGLAPARPPLHFTHVRIEEAASPSGDWVPVGSLAADGGLTLDRQNIVGQTRWYRGVAVDKSRSESEPGPHTEAKITSKVSAELEQARQEVKQAVQDAIQNSQGTILNQLEDKLKAIDVGSLVPGDRPVHENVISKLWADGIAARTINSVRTTTNELIVASEKNPIDGVRIKDGTVDASKIRGLKGMFDQIDVNRLLAGKITSAMFQAGTGFRSKNVTVTADGVVVTGDDGGKVVLNEHGFFVNAPNEGGTPIWIKADGSAFFKGDIKAGSTVSMLDSSNTGAVLTSSEIQYLERNRNIGALSWRVLVAPPQGYIDCGQTSAPLGGWSDLNFGYGGRQWAEFGMTVTSGGLVAPISGRYLVTGNAGVRGHGDSLVGVAVSTPGWAGGINVQTTQWAIGNGIEQTITATGVIDVRAGETIQLKIHNSGGDWATVGKAALFAKCISAM